MCILKSFETYPLLSIIIPVYNIEQYLEECLDSVINQSYNNLEIIIVDDGSTDMSGKICDRYLELDSRVIVIHQTNKGLCNVRNLGISIAKGEIIGFVDGDDFIHLEMYEHLIDALLSYNADISFCSYIRFNEEGFNQSFSEDIICYTSEEMLDFYVKGHEKFNFSPAVWKRIYHKNIIKDISFPEGRCYEDIVWSAKAISKASNLVYVDKGYYNYRVRNDSICDNDFRKGKRITKRIITDLFLSIKEEISVLKNAGKYELVGILEKSYLNKIIVAYYRIKCFRIMELNSFLPQLKNEKNNLIIKHIQCNNNICTKFKLIIKLRFTFLFYVAYCIRKKYLGCSDIIKERGKQVS